MNKARVINPWSHEQIKEFCRDAVEELGGRGAWKILSEPLQKAVIAQKAFKIVRGSLVPVSVQDMNVLLYEMEMYSGLE